MNELEAVRQAQELLLARDPQSPLNSEPRAQFAGPECFAENGDLRFEVVAEARSGVGPIHLQASTGGPRTCARGGRFGFQVESRAVELTIFQGPDGRFLPFVDALAGKQTYRAGRYLDPEPLPGDCCLVDFNLAHNPYCAYNEYWTCRLTPFENRVKVPIPAGETIFRDPR